MTGVLKGYDQLLNLVLDEAVEYLRGVWGCGQASRSCELDCLGIQRLFTWTVATHQPAAPIGSSMCYSCYTRCYCHSAPQSMGTKGVTPCLHQPGLVGLSTVLRACLLLVRVHHHTALFIACCPADPTDPMRITDATRELGVVVSVGRGATCGYKLLWGEKLHSLCCESDQQPGPACCCQGGLKY